MSKESATQHTLCVPSTSFISHRSYSGSLGLAMGSSVHAIIDKVAGTAVIFTLEPWQSSVSTSQAKDPALPMARCRSRAPRALHDCTLHKAVECLTSEDLKIVHSGVRFVFSPNVYVAIPKCKHLGNLHIRLNHIFRRVLVRHTSWASNFIAATLKPSQYRQALAVVSIIAKGMQRLTENSTGWITLKPHPAVGV